MGSQNVEHAYAGNSGNAYSASFDSLRGLAHEVGAGWGVIYLLAFFCFIPTYGLIPLLARLWKEDRADARQKKLDTEKAKAKYSNRRKSDRK